MPPSEEEGYQKACGLTRKSTKLLQSFFKTRWRHLAGREWRSTDYLEFISGLGRDVFENMNSIDKLKVQSGNVEDWDILLLSKILLSSKITSESTKTGKEQVAAIQTLRILRNTVNNLSQKKLPWKEYKQLEKSFKQAEKIVKDPTKINFVAIGRVIVLVFVVAIVQYYVVTK